ncbi:hypothetical protein TMEC54S_00245 [Thauera mechernichensis]
MAQYQANEEQIRLSEALLVAMANEDVIRPIVEGYETAILEKHRFKIDPKWTDIGVEDHVILHRKETFLLSDADAKVFFEECFAARDEAGLAVDRPDSCPLLAAENLRISAENALIKSLACIPGLEPFATGILSLNTRAKVLKLALELFLPSCSDAKTILQRYREMCP